MYLLDTNVISELSRHSPNQGVLAWFQQQRSISLSAVTVEEMTFGIERLPVGQNLRLLEWFSRLLAIPPEILAVDSAVARLAGQLRAKREKAGRTVTQADMLIAATALIFGRILVTRNTKDFSECGVTLLNPFA